jgi:hypothetical protein
MGFSALTLVEAGRSAGLSAHRSCGHRIGAQLGDVQAAAPAVSGAEPPRRRAPASSAAPWAVCTASAPVEFIGWATGWRCVASAANRLAPVPWAGILARPAGRSGPSVPSANRWLIAAATATSAPWPPPENSSSSSSTHCATTTSAPCTAHPARREHMVHGRRGSCSS